MESKPKKSRKIKLTQKQALATKIILANPGISIAAAKRKAGYTESGARNPQELTRSKAFREVMDKAGITDTFLAKGHRDALQSVELKEREFIDVARTELIEIDPESKDYKKDGREKQFREEIIYNPVPDKKIKDFFKKIPGAKLIDIELGYRKKVAVYTMPLYAARSKYHELGYKTKGLMAPEQHDHGVFHEPTDEEKQLIKDIFSQQ